jgi:uncharacterized protein (TIGR01777 family)
MGTFVRSTSFEQSRAQLSRWHLQSTALLRLVPAWSGVRVVILPPRLEDDAIVELNVPIPPFRRKLWRSVIEEVSENGFYDVQEAGPFRSWRHHHQLLEREGDTSRLEDSVTYSFKEPWPLSVIGTRVLEAGLIRTFNWRHQRTTNDLRRHHETGWSRRRVLVTGSSGLVGRALCAFLETGGWEVRRLVRRKPDPTASEFAWDPQAGTIDHDALEGVDAVIHLAGAGVADKRWSEARMKLIRDSRVDSTRLLSEAIAARGEAAPVMICASAVGYYGNRSEGTVDERSEPGTGFLASTCVDWEAAAEPARAAGARVVNFRIGVVVASGGGAIAKLRPVVLTGLGGPIGSGRQGMGWIALDDLLAVIQQSVVDDRYQGPINAVSPKPIDNRGFMRTMGRVLRRPVFLPMPAPVVRTLFGRMGQEALLDGAFVLPSRLVELGFRYDFPELDDALHFELGIFR